MNEPSPTFKRLNIIEAFYGVVRGHDWSKTGVIGASISSGTIAFQASASPVDSSLISRTVKKLNERQERCQPYKKRRVIGDVGLVRPEIGQHPALGIR